MIIIVINGLNKYMLFGCFYLMGYFNWLLDFKKGLGLVSGKKGVTLTLDCYVSRMWLHVLFKWFYLSQNESRHTAFNQAAITN
jgi:hypothetical protein